MLVLFSCRIFLDDSFTKIPFNYCSLNLDKNLASKVSLKNGLLKTEWHKKGPLLMRSTHMEKKWLRDCPSHFKPVLYRRYVDDTFLLFENESNIDLFLQFLNSQHPNISFTCDT